MVVRRLGRDDSRDPDIDGGGIMQAEELLRRAAAIIAEGGWSQGAMARDETGRPVSLFKGDDARSGINPAAVSFSMYGALVKAMNEASAVGRVPLVWDVLLRLTSGLAGVPGGTNHVQPVHGFNEAEGRTVDDVLGLLELAAQDCERAAQTKAVA